MVHYSEHLSIKPRQLWWIPAVGAATVMGGSIVLLPAVLVAWFYSLLRYGKAHVTVEDYQVRVGGRTMPLAWLDPATLGHPRNVWPWFVLSQRRLACVPFWTSGALGISGRNAASKRVWLSLGTNDRDALAAALIAGIARANSPEGIAAARAAGIGSGAPVRPAAPPGWYPDPWDPVRSLRWFDGASWTGWTSGIPGRGDARTPGTGTGGTSGTSGGGTSTSNTWWTP